MNTTHQEQMSILLRRAREVDLWTFEGSTREALAWSLEVEVTAILSDACALLSEIIAAHGSDTTSAIVADVAFVAHVELRQRLVRVLALGPNDSALLVMDESDGSLRRVAKALCAIDQAIAETTGVPARLEYLSTLEVSLRVRRAYAVFRSRLLARIAAHPNDESYDDVRARLLAAGHEIAVLIGMPIYPFLRLSDRLHLRSLQKRTIAWIREQSDAANGLHLWQDIAATLSMFALVNRRQELTTHDGDVIKQILGQLRCAVEADAPVPVPATETKRTTRLDDAQWTELQHLEGRDAEIDALLAEGERSALRWTQTLDRVYGEISGGESATTLGETTSSSSSSRAA